MGSRHKVKANCVYKQFIVMSIVIGQSGMCRLICWPFTLCHVLFHFHHYIDTCIIFPDAIGPVLECLPNECFITCLESCLFLLISCSLPDWMWNVIYWVQEVYEALWTGNCNGSLFRISVVISVIIYEIGCEIFDKCDLLDV